MSLLKEINFGAAQNALRVADGSSAGKADVAADPAFSAERNTINKTSVTGAAVNDYLERAHELNDEVESVGFALQDTDGALVKVYVNATQADAFEEALSTMLGLDNDIETALNQMAQKFDVIDVVWPDNAEPELTAPDAFSIEDPHEELDEPEEPEKPEESSSAEENDEPEPPQEDVDLSDPTDDEADEKDEETEKSADKKNKRGKKEVKESLRFFVEQTVSARGGPITKRLDGFATEVEAVMESLRLSTAFPDRSFVVKESEEVAGATAQKTDGLDTQHILLTNRLRLPLEQDLIAFYAASGIIGRFLLAVDTIEDSVRETADMLRKKTAVRHAFADFFAALVAEQGIALESKARHGSTTQKKFEAVLVALGLPQEILIADHAGSVSHAVARVARNIDASNTLHQLLNSLALRLGITVHDLTVMEDANLMANRDSFVEAVLELAAMLGIPEKNLEYNRSAVVAAIRDKKASLSSYSTIERRARDIVTLVRRTTRAV